MNLAVIVAVLMVLFVVASGIFYLRRNAYIENEHSFSQAGVTVDYAAQTIAIDGRPYSVHAVNDVRHDADQGCVAVAINDAQNPLHKIEFASPRDAEVFAQRCLAAIAKAGGPLLGAQASTQTRGRGAGLDLDRDVA